MDINQKPRFHPNSPVQPDRSPAPYFIIAVVAALAIWTAMQVWSQNSHLKQSNNIWLVPDGAAPPPPLPPPASPAAVDRVRVISRTVGPDLRRLFASDDYPRDAARNNEQGTVQARLDIDGSGRPTKCTIIRSATPRLNYATCSILLQRARFSPPRDANGRATTNTMTTPPITWRLEG